MCMFASVCEEAASASGQAAGVAAASVSACDFQWSGGGLAVTDVMYLLWTSVSSQVVQQQETQLLQ